MSTDAPSSDSPRIEVLVAAPVETVWKALRDRESIRNWHGWDDPSLDAEIETIFFTDVVEDAAQHTLTIRGGDVFAVEGSTQGGCLVRLTRVPYGNNPEWDPYYDDITQGWITFLHQLRFTLERQPDAVRTTVFLSGQDPTTSPIAALGLTDVAGQPAGTRYATSLAGQDVEGTVWFRTEHQLGLTVEGWSAGKQDGLLVVAHNPSQDGPSAGAAMAVVSTYGLAQSDLDALATAWTAWWNARYPAPSDDAAAATVQPDGAAGGP